VALDGRMPENILTNKIKPIRPIKILYKITSENNNS
jgi:hypothetical protein